MTTEVFFQYGGWWAVLLVTAIATYFWRGLGVVLSGHVSQEGEIFRWLSAVTYALLGALAFRLLILPIGPLAEVSILFRLLACVVSLAVMLSKPGRLFPSLISGCGLVMAYGLFQ